MNRKVKLLLSGLAWIALFAYLIFAVRYCGSENNEIEITGTKIEIIDSLNSHIITPGMVEQWLSQSGLELLNKQAKTVNTREIEQMIKQKGFVKTARVYVDLKGVLNIDIEQRVPIVRFNTTNGYNFYVTEDNYILPLQNHWVCYVPVVSGSMDFPFERDYVGSFEKIDAEKIKKYEKSYYFCSKLINFVKFISRDKFWNSQIVQINVSESTQKTVNELGLGSGGRFVSEKYGQVELIPRIGDHIIMLGDLDGFEQKLEKLLRFYDEALKFEGWEEVKYINLKYENQVVVSK